MDADDLKADLHGYLQNARDALTWKLSGLSEYDVRRPLTPNVDMWATADESRDETLAVYLRACAHSNATIDELDIDAVGQVASWPEGRRTVTLHRILVHMLAETSRHAGHADIVRELVDGAAGWGADARNLPSDDREWWAAHRDRVERAARDAEQASGRFA
jgi:hypothetical protein